MEQPAAAARSPALPWAAGNTEEATEEVEGAAAPVPDVERCMTLEQVGLHFGSRIEVKWKIDKEDGSSDVRWWGATVASIAGSNGEAPLVYPMRYDAYDEFEEEVVIVAFIGQHELRSTSTASEDDEEDGAGEDAVLFWRKEGEAWEPPADEDTAGADASPDETYCLHDVLDRLPDEQSLQADEAAALAELEPSQQRQVVEGFRGWMDDFKAFLAAKVDMAKESGNENVTITADVIEDFKAQMRTKRQRIDYGTGGSL